jgi:hypothetical protein
VIGINVGVMLLSAENVRTGNVWRWFMGNREIPRAMSLIGLNLYRNPRVINHRGHRVHGGNEGEIFKLDLQLRKED